MIVIRLKINLILTKFIEKCKIDMALNTSKNTILNTIENIENLWFSALGTLNFLSFTFFK